MARSAGICLIVGALLWVSAAISPVAFRVFGRPVEEQVTTIAASPGGWRFINLAFGSGSVVATIGLLLFAVVTSSLDGPNYVRWLAWAAAIMAGVGLVLWLLIIADRIISPQNFTSPGGSGAAWWFPAYTVLTQLAIITLGYVVLQSGFPAWLGWVLMLLAGLSLVTFLIVRDMVPATHYLLLLVLGIMLLRR